MGADGGVAWICNAEHPDEMYRLLEPTGFLGVKSGHASEDYDFIDDHLSPTERSLSGSYGTHLDQSLLELKDILKCIQSIVTEWGWDPTFKEIKDYDIVFRGSSRRIVDINEDIFIKFPESFDNMTILEWVAKVQEAGGRSWWVNSEETWT